MRISNVLKKHFLEVWFCVTVFEQLRKGTTYLERVDNATAREGVDGQQPCDGWKDTPTSVWESNGIFPSRIYLSTVACCEIQLC